MAVRVLQLVVRVVERALVVREPLEFLVRVVKVDLPTAMKTGRLVVVVVVLLRLVTTVMVRPALRVEMAQAHTRLGLL
jgi:hypothetical protein